MLKYVTLRNPNTANMLDQSDQRNDQTMQIKKLNLTTLARVLSLAFAVPLFSGLTHNEAQALTYQERQKLDLRSYEVTDPDASYFNVDKRINELQNTHNSILIGLKDKLQLGQSCRYLLSIPPLDKEIRIPGFYPKPDAWERATEPLFQFEDIVSSLAGNYVATMGDAYYGRCLIQFLNKWAESEALVDFYYSGQDKQGDGQAWYSTESMIFAAAMAYSVVRPRIEGMEQEKTTIDKWLNLLAHNHSSIIGGDNGSCCNNHFYRRALYSSIVGILTEDNELFRYGVSAVYSALSDLTKDGALPLEIQRGRRAVHYQNYALLYLVTNMQVISRQGYDVFDKEIDGRNISDAVDFFLTVVEDPAELEGYATQEQYLGFLDDSQYFTWMEIYLSHFEDSRVNDFLNQYRPVSNRGAGGHISLYFMDPDAQQLIVLQETVKEKVELIIPDTE
ncbi:alginate lyase family protein [Halomonas sp. McH1-25]|uniref:alginate lyase family protein n=1 Tax=unclassified Halomonas TaxID=2609666 RepID=UPI001EF5CAEC|nr:MULTISPECIES: alginate lyase family protein [unclassified Halomonas]MCG7600822.1 alginate lyase family protein [Halomonas sp. McH1-25]MCP1344333.1 alginate lyase family protein [Halomonas sp. FL8]MCP1362998.1 alginate lyase family protein [Halomonas sp. BBD45]MCP1364187.1 alginate lyase family protein [Halomonas sp. BBD48]